MYESQESLFGNVCVKGVGFKLSRGNGQPEDVGVLGSDT